MDNNKTDAFINGSFIGENVKLAGDVVFQRTELSPEELASVRDEGRYVIDKDQRICEFEIDGKAFDRGRIVRKKKGYYFKVIEIYGGEK